MNNRAVITVLAIVSLSCSLVYANDAIEGAYERVSLLNTRTGESPEAANRQGLLILAHGHYSMMTMNPQRRVLENNENLEDLTPTEQITFLQEWLDINGHTGRYEVEDNELIWHRDISENPSEVGTTSRLKFEQRDNSLVLSFTLPNGDLYEWIWRRID